MKLVKMSAIITMLLLLLAATALSGCSSPLPTAAPTATPTPGQVVLTINGSVREPKSLTIADLRQDYGQYAINATTTNAAGVTIAVNGSGPKLIDLVNSVGVSPYASNITFISPGYSSTIPLDVVWKSKNGAVVIKDDGTLEDVIPGQSAVTWVDNLTAIMIL